ALDVLKAKETYGRAQALLGDAAQVATARREHAIEAFQRSYPEGKYEKLQQLFDSIPEAERGPLRDFADRVAGRGELTVAASTKDGAATPSVMLKAFQGGRLAERWTPLPESHALPMGDYLVRAEAADQSTAMRRV